VAGSPDPQSVTHRHRLSRHLFIRISRLRGSDDEHFRSPRPGEVRGRTGHDL